MGSDAELERFQKAAEKAYAAGGVESLAIALRHFIHPSGYGRAFEFMAICAEVSGQPVDEQGVWQPGAHGELWLPRVLTMRKT